MTVFLVQDVPATELNPGLHHVAFTQEFSRMLRFKLKVVRIGTRPKSNFLE